MQVFSGKIINGIEKCFDHFSIPNHTFYIGENMTKKYYTLPLSFAPLPNDPRVQNLTGQIFNRLKVLGFAGRLKLALLWFCQCECGRIVAVSRSRLKNGSTRSCGCLRILHSASETTEYKSFVSARCRCLSTKSMYYKYYGGRGIEFRFNSFEEFLTEVGFKPTPKHSLDRIDVNGHYEKGNIRWATLTEQARNKRSNRYIEFNGESKTIPEWAEIFNLPQHVIRTRIKLGSCLDCVFLRTNGKHCLHKSGNNRLNFFGGNQPTLHLI